MTDGVERRVVSTTQRIDRQASRAATELSRAEHHGDSNNVEATRIQVIKGEQHYQTEHHRDSNNVEATTAQVIKGMQRFQFQIDKQAGQQPN